MGYTEEEGKNSRSVENIKHKVDDSDSINTAYHLAHHKEASLLDESGLKSDQIVNGSISMMLGVQGQMFYLLNYLVRENGRTKIPLLLMGWKN